MNISTVRTSLDLWRFGGGVQILIPGLSHTESSAEILKQVHETFYQQFLRANLI